MVKQMHLPVEYMDTNGVLSNKSYNLPRLAFAKHLSFAGQGYAPSPKKIMRAISMFIHYSSYLNRTEFYSGRFSEPPIQLSDPTEKGQFSSLAGKAIADFLSKKIDGSLLTVNYEAAMRIKGMPIMGRRPDLLAYTKNACFAVEAKGFSGMSGDMAVHKAQAGSGKIATKFNVACVSYNLYNQVKCKYHDPINGNYVYDDELFKSLTKRYYSGLLEFLNNDYFEYEEVEIQQSKFYAVNIKPKFFLEIFPRNLFRFHYWHELIYMGEFDRLRLILPKEIKMLATEGMANDSKPFLFISNENNNLYIDNDRVGLELR